MHRALGASGRNSRCATSTPSLSSWRCGMPATSELRVFTAVLSKNWRLKTATRGIALCSGARVFISLQHRSTHAA